MSLLLSSSLNRTYTIGVIGIGLLGTSIIYRLLDCDTKVNVYGRNPKKLKDFKLKGARIFDSPCSLANESNFIITCVTNFESVKDVLFDKNNGVINCNNNNLIVSDFSTINSDESLHCSKVLSKKNGLKFLSTPVMGGPRDVKNGELVTLVSGEKESFIKMKSVFEILSKRIFYIGETNGMSNSVKLSLNLNIALITLALSEGLILAKHSGIDLDLYLQIFNTTKFKTGISENKGKKMINKDYTPSFFLSNMLKDIDLVMETCQNLGLFLPLTSLSQQLFRAVNNQKDKKDKDYSIIYQFLDELNLKK